MSNPKPLPTDKFSPREQVSDLILELAVKPPGKGMASVKAATDVFEANQPGVDASAEDVGLGHGEVSRPVDTTK